ncbi:MAG: hypothetical protein WDN69_15850 [Aliidongia sp.]
MACGLLQHQAQAFDIAAGRGGAGEHEEIGLLGQLLDLFLIALAEQRDRIAEIELRDQRLQLSAQRPLADDAEPRHDPGVEQPAEGAQRVVMAFLFDQAADAEEPHRRSGAA